MMGLQRTPSRFPYQDKFGGSDNPPGHRGNCFQACLAGMLCLPLSMVPHFYDADESNEQTHTKIVRWLAERGWFMWSYSWSNLRLWQSEGLLQVPTNTLAIFSGASPRGNWSHAVLGRFTDGWWQLVHDPHPDKTGLIGDPEIVELFAPMPWIPEPTHG